jgi:outer membrane protein OmpA-like peptidoglycan-associated protein
MKKFLLSFAFLAFSAVGVNAQESAEYLRWRGITNNSFGSNWELTLGGGVNAVAWNKWGNHQKSTGDVGWQVELGATKWFNPIVGARLQFIWGQLNVSDDNGLKSNWIFPHADAVLNLSNWIGGYREDRVYYAKLFAGAGVSIVNVNSDASSGMAAVGGMINTFRVSDALDINLELKAMLSAGRDMPRGIAELAGKTGQVYSATVGLTYRFNKRDWGRSYNQDDVDGYLASILALETALVETQRNEGKLVEQLAAQESIAEQDVKENTTLREEIKQEQTIHTVVGATALFFNINSARLSDRAKASLELVMKTIKEAPADRTFTIVGHADAKTGSPAYNQTLSEERAKAVYDYLVSHGIESSRLTWKGVGSTDSIFPVYFTNRVVIIK